MTDLRTLCEFCKQSNSGEYGSGRFCSKKCARAFSSSDKRDEINKKVSRKMKGRLCHPMTDLIASKISEKSRNKLMTSDFDSLSLEMKKKRVILEQKGCCFICGISKWREEVITLHVDHVDGDTEHNSRENLRGLCPNCHSLTPTYCGRNRKTSKEPRVSDEKLLEALLTETTIAGALKSVGYMNKSAHHYKRCRNLLKDIKNR